MAARGLFLNFDTATLLSLISAAQTALTTGGNRILVSSNIGGLAGQNEWYMKPEDVLEEANYALKLRGASTYGNCRRTAIKFV